MLIIYAPNNTTADPIAPNRQTYFPGALDYKKMLPIIGLGESTRVKTVVDNLKNTFIFLSKHCCLKQRGRRIPYVIALLLLWNTTAGAYQLLSLPEQPIQGDADQNIQTLLNEHWGRTPQNALASEKFYENLNSPPAVVSIAYAVNRLQQNKTNEAKLVAEQITKTFPNNLDGWMLKAWLNALEDNFENSLVSIRSLNQRLIATADLSVEIKSSIYSRLGRLIGYLEGPVAHRVNQNLLLTTTQFITNTAPQNHLKEFNSSRTEVQEKYTEIKKDQAQKKNEELAKVAQRDQKIEQILNRENESLSDSEQKLSEEIERVRQDANARISTLESQGSQIEQEQLATSIEIQQRENRLLYLYEQLAILNLGPVSQFWTYDPRVEIRSLEFQISQKRSDWNGYSFRLRSISDEISRLQFAAQQRTGSLTRDLKKLNGTRRRNLGKLARIASGPQIADGKKNAMKIRVTSLITYDEISEELYRQQILDQFPRD